MVILDGKLASQAIKSQLKEQVSQIGTGRKPHLAAILVGNDGASETYVASKVRSCEETGFESTLIRLSKDAKEQELLERVAKIIGKDVAATKAWIESVSFNKNIAS